MPGIPLGSSRETSMNSACPLATGADWARVWAGRPLGAAVTPRVTRDQPGADSPLACASCGSFSRRFATPGLLGLSP